MTNKKYTPTERDTTLMNDPTKWPRGQVLCVKKLNPEGFGWPNVGFLVNTPETYFPGRYTVFWDKKGNPYPERVTREVMNKMYALGNVSLYPTLSALMDDGWVVD